MKYRRTLFIISLFALTPAVTTFLSRSPSNARPFPRLGVRSFWNETFQQEFVRRLGKCYGGRVFLDRLHNSLYFALFHEFPTDRTVILGHNNTLFSKYEQRNLLTQSVVAVDEIAADVFAIRRMVRPLSEQGQVAMVVMTPHKAHFYLREVPWEWRSEDPFDIQPLTKRYEMAWEEAGIPYANPVPVLELAKRSGFDVFPRWGHHWNSFAVCLAANEIVGELKKRSRWSLNRRNCEAARAEISESENDLFELARPFDFLLRFPVGAAKAVDFPLAPSDKPSMLFIGSSFVNELAQEFGRRGEASRLKSLVFDKIVTYSPNVTWGPTVIPLSRPHHELCNEADIVFLDFHLAMPNGQRLAPTVSRDLLQFFLDQGDQVTHRFYGDDLGNAKPEIEARFKLHEQRDLAHGIPARDVFKTE